MPRIISSRTYVNQNANLDDLSKTKTLKQIAEQLQRWTAKLDPKDYRYAMDKLFVDFKGTYLTAQWTHNAVPTKINSIGKAVQEGVAPTETETLYFRRKGISDIQQQVLPPSFFSGLKQLSLLDATGADLATKVWNKFGSTKTKPVLVRTVRTDLNYGTNRKPEIVRVIRNCQSTGYAPYSHLMLVSDLLSHGQSYGKMPIMNWKLSDSGIRIQFACFDKTMWALAATDKKILEEEPIPVVAAWNSETGQRKVGIGAGVYLLRNGVFIGSTNRLGTEQWIHRGDMTRIRGALQSKYTQMMTEATKAAQDYTDATDIVFESNDPGEVQLMGKDKADKQARKRWLTKQLSGLTEVGQGEVWKVIGQAGVAEANGTDSPLLAPVNSLAACVEAIAIRAVEAPGRRKLGQAAQLKQETLASQVLKAGLKAAHRTDAKGVVSFPHSIQA